MIRYSWPALVKATKGSTPEILLALETMLPDYKPRNRSKSLYRYKYNHDFTGDSYLLNPEQLLKSKHLINAYYLCQYIYLASFRSYPEYIYNGNKSLDFDLSPIRDIDKIKQNELLTLSKNTIYFKFEGK